MISTFIAILAVIGACQTWLAVLWFSRTRRRIDALEIEIGRVAYRLTRHYHEKGSA